ncbi:TrbG/VirB9 family P-type conjugative transfer protein [Qipengyuania sediminis]|uniref:TrbG/VirB9 family P-type conjugative transfer protein n=1 Tax=Qipengyuania sediminis TaxID=1532023 RepID=UPI0010595609|nr:TrbG/VirB9 family P-type conjugative transfer protein [Qipengyuania sediminis]
MRSLALALILFSAPLAAQVLPEPGTPNPRLQTVRWQDGQVIRLAALPATGLTVLLEPGERVATVEADGSAVDARVSSERDGLLLIPRREGELGIVTAKTDSRTYRFALRTGTDLMAAYLVRFVDASPTSGQEPIGGPVPTPPPLPLAAPAPLPTMPGIAVWTYRVKGHAEVRPTSIRDDGVRTVISFAEGAPLPAVFAIGASGEEQVVNGYMRSGQFVIDEVCSELVFRIDGKKAVARRNLKPDGTNG